MDAGIYVILSLPSSSPLLSLCVMVIASLLKGLTSSVVIANEEPSGESLVSSRLQCLQLACQMLTNDDRKDDRMAAVKELQEDTSFHITVSKAGATKAKEYLTSLLGLTITTVPAKSGGSATPSKKKKK
jgi:hypothetical protein